MSTALNNALSGLRISQQQISVISNNVSNVGTPGYTRKILPQSTLTVAGEAIGVRADTLIRNVDLNLTRDLWTQVSAVNSLDIQRSYLQRIEQFHGPPDKELSVAADLARLQDAFAALADSPEDTSLLALTVNQAVDTANKINDLDELITTLRNDAQTEISTTVTEINDLLVQIAELNSDIVSRLNFGQTTAQLEDLRDGAIQELSGLIDISFFQRGDGALVIQTNQGIELASDRAEQLTFAPGRLSPSIFYPDPNDNITNAIFVGDPTAGPAAFDITATSPGGKLGGLITLRDVTFPKQTAQLDELAHKLALRFDAQGLRLFTDASGAIPADTAPDPTTLPNPTPVEYVGFASVIQVNETIINDNTLIQRGTYGDTTIQTGSNEVIRRVIENTFGNVEFQEIFNSDVARQVDLLNTGGADLQNWLGLFSENTISGGRDLTAYASVGDIVTFANGALDDPNDQFQITFEEARTGLGPTTITVDLSVANGFAGATALDQLVAHINNEIALAGVPAGLAAVASASPDGELVINTRGSIEIDSTSLPTGIQQTGLNFLGLSDNTGAPIAPTDPYFDIQVGNDTPVRIFIEPGDTQAELLTKLDAVEGLAIDTVNFAIDGILRLRPGDDFNNPNFGGEIQITSGSFTSNGALYGAPPATSARLALDNGVNVVSALFGTYTTGVSIQDESPVTDILYGSDTNGALAPPIPTTSFRESLLGPNADISTNVNGSLGLIDFAQRMVNEHTQELVLTSERIDDEGSLQTLLQDRLTNQSGVNLDEELGHLIVVQTAYSASARVLTAVDELFQELLNAVR